MLDDRVKDWILNLHLLQTSKIASGLTVASIDSGSSISTVGVVCKAGPRNESYDNLGKYIYHLAIFPQFPQSKKKIVKKFY